MSIILLLTWALVGWTGVVWPPQLPPPPPPGQKGWFSARFVNMIGAVIGGWIWHLQWPVGAQTSPGLGAAASCIGAIVGAALAADIAYLVFGLGKKAA
jgi:hypothetical protein